MTAPFPTGRLLWALMLTPLAVIGLELGRRAARSAGDGALPEPQFLPVQARWCLAPDRCLELEVADTPARQARGMQGRPPLPSLRGMWFPFRPPQMAYFWMHLTPAPLDMVFVSGGRVVGIQEAAQPCLRLPCPTYASSAPVEGVIELGAGQAAALGIRPGTPVRITPLR